MRGTVLPISRLPAARALIAGVAILASVTAMKAHAQSPTGSDESAYAVARTAPNAASGVALPEPLPPSEAQRLRRIFALQAAGRLAEAERETAAVDTTTPVGQAMLGHVLAARYLGPGLRAEAKALAAWLATWPALPEAPSIHALLKARLPRNQAPPPPPALPMLGEAEGDLLTPVPEEAETGTRLTRNRAVEHAVAEAARTGAGAVEHVLARSPGLSAEYAALLRGQAARALFAANRDEDALALAAPVAGTAALAGHVAGLAAWRLHRAEQALPLFEAAWHAPVTSAALRAGAAFWAARAHLGTHDPAGWYAWLERAGAEQRTFYGLLALRMLGRQPGALATRRETLGEADIDAIAATEAGTRAFALIQVGQPARAEAELRLLWPEARDQPALARAVMLVAERAGLVDLAAQLADLVQTADGQPRESMRFPIPHLRPRGGFSADPALVYGLARTESNFNNATVSRAGARGLMQLMPATARAVGAETRSALRDPAVNLDIGQRYLGYLAGLDSVGGNLLHLLASYNSGPFGFTRWNGAQQDGGDPLLFLESIPGDETRAFIPRVLAYTWIYAARLRLPAPSLDELAAGGWPRYHAPDAALAAK